MHFRRCIRAVLQMRRDVLLAIGLFAAMFMISSAPGPALYGHGEKGSISSGAKRHSSASAGERMFRLRTPRLSPTSHNASPSPT